MKLHLVVVLLVASAFCLSCAAEVAHGNSTVPDPLALSFGRQHGSNKRAAAYIHMELLLLQVVAECAKGEDTFLQLDSQGQLQVLQKLTADAPCPALDIALRGSERGVGMCTDVALYLLHMGRTGEAGRGARIIPLLPAAEMTAYNAKCTQTTARMFLESMYHEWLAPSASGGFHLMQVNSEHMFKVHEALHKEMDVFLCKTEFCQQLLVQYVTQKGWKAEVWYMGHTSSDVLVSAPARSSSGTGNTQFVTLDSSKDQDSTRQQHQVQSLGSESSVTPVHADYNQFLHVKGKSGLKHTTQLLECWMQHPEFPTLTVIGQTSVKDDIVQKVAMGSVKNVQLLPKPAQDESIAAAVRDMARRLAIAAAAPAAESLTAVAAAATPAPVPAAAAPAVPTPAQPPAGANKAAATAVPGQPAAGPKQPMAQGSAIITSSGSSSALSTATAKPAAYPEPVHQFGRRRKPIRQSKQAALQQQQQQKQPSTVVRQTAQQQQQQPEKLVTPPVKQKQKEQQQGQPRQQPQTQESNRPRQQAHQPATQFGRRRKQPTQQQQQALPQQQQQQQVAASAAAPAVADSAELQQSKQKVLELFSTLGLNAEPIAATRRLLGRSTAVAIAAMRRLLTSSSSKSSSAATTVADKDKEALRLAGKHLGWIPTAVDKDQLLGFDDIRQFQASSGVQICVSEREGFGHYLNEARAAGALVISTDHPPMNELVQDGVSGVLVKPSRTGSYQEWQALGSYSHINAYVTPANICAAVQRVLAMPVEQRRQLGLQARQQYLQDKAQFVEKLRVLRKTLHRWRMEGRYKPSGQSSAEDQ